MFTTVLALEIAACVLEICYQIFCVAQHLISLLDVPILILVSVCQENVVHFSTIIVRGKT